MLVVVVSQQQDIQGFLRFEPVSDDFRLGVNVVRPYDNGILLGSDKALVRSTDEGRSWVPLLSPLQRKDITAITAYKNDIVVGTASGGLFTSNDRGLYWERFGQDAGVMRVRSLVRTADAYVVVNDSGRCFRRTDHADVWNPIRLPAPCVAVTMFDDATWYLCSNGAILTERGKEPELKRVLRAGDHTDLVAVDDRLAVLVDGLVMVLDDDADSLATFVLPIANWTACAAMGENLLVGGRATGLSKINLENGTVTSVFAGPAELENISALATSNDTVVIGTSKGAARCYVVAQTTLQWHALSPNALVSTFDVTDLVYTNGQVYVATRGEGVHMGPASSSALTSIHDGYDQAGYAQLLPLRDDMLVVARYGGLLRLRKGSNKVEWFTHTLPVASGYVGAVVDDRVIVGQGAGVVWSEDDGRTWTLSAATLPHINHMYTASTVVYASTMQGLYSSHDKGMTWQVVQGPWQSNNVMWTSGVPDTLVISTTNATYAVLGGREARKLEAVFPGRPPSPFITAQLHRGLLFTTGAPGIYVTSDMGTTWQEKTIPGSAAIIAQFFYKGYYYVFTDVGNLWRSPVP